MIRRFPVEVLVGQHHTLRPVGGAGGIHQPHQVGRKPAMRLYGPGFRPKPRSVGLRGDIDQDDGSRSRRARTKFLVGDENARAGIFDDVGDFVRCQPVIDRQEDRADMARRESDIEKCRAVLHQHGDDIVRTNPARREPSADDPNPFVESRVGDFFAAVFQRTALRRLAGVKCDEARWIDHYSPGTAQLARNMNSDS